MRVCSLCGKESVEELLNAGPQPVCNRFLADRVGKEYRHPMILGQCASCGLLQLIDPVPCAELLPPYDWITYKEPERHLDELADIIALLPDVGKESVICGASFKDDTLLRRMNERGIANTWRLDPEKDLGIVQRSAGVETVQERITPATAGAIARKRGPANIVIARHILEHAYDMPRLMGGLRGLLRPDGYLVLEVPDCRRAFDTFDYTTLWEEHISYFTGVTFRNAIPLLGCEPLRFERYPYPFEDSLVCICRFGGRASLAGLKRTEIDGELKRGAAFARGFPSRKEALRTFLRRFKEGGGGIALFGAGHLACVFANLFELADMVDFVADDNPNKRGMFLPGSRLPVRPSSALLESDARLCLLCLSPESEAKVIESNSEFQRRGGRFASVMPLSARALEALTSASG